MPVLPPNDNWPETAFWAFVVERQNIFRLRNKGDPPPWTEDKVLGTHRFTNVYRASDRVSQYLLRHVQYDREWSPEDLVFRTLLFRIYNNIPTWEWLLANLGEPCLANWNVTDYSLQLTHMASAGYNVWTSAYMVTPPVFSYGYAKHYGWNIILNQIVTGGGIERILNATDSQAIYETLRRYPTVGEFFAWQWTVDICYSNAVPNKEPFSEDWFVVPGPGAKRGAHKIFGATKTPGEAIRYLTDVQASALPYRFHWLGQRRLSQMDIQNCLCEFDKYSRVVYPQLQDEQRYYTKIKQKYNAAKAHKPIRYMYPPKWGISEADANNWQLRTTHDFFKGEN